MQMAACVTLLLCLTEIKKHLDGGKVHPSAGSPGNDLADPQ